MRALFLLFSLPFLLSATPFLLSPPKCGTHLLAKAVSELTGIESDLALGAQFGSTGDLVRHLKRVDRAGKFPVVHHMPLRGPALLAARGYKLLFLMRDPRDQIASAQRWLREGQWSWLAASKISDPKEQMDEMITGRRFGWSPTNKYWSLFEHVRRAPAESLLMVRFEDLVGPQGGGSRERQIEALEGLARFLEVRVSPARIEEIADNLYGGTGTYRKGRQVGRWKERLEDGQIDLFETIYDRFLKESGYRRKIDIAICAIFRDEAPWLEEWIEFHQLIGVDHFLLYNHKSVDEWEAVLAPYIEEGVVEVVDWDHSGAIEPIQRAAYDDGLVRLRGHCDWVAFIDIDEFLCPMKVDSLPEVLSDFKGAAGLVVNWNYFSTCGVEHLGEGELLTERIHRSSGACGWNSHHVKSIVRPEYAISARNAHRFHFVEGAYAVDTNGRPSIGDGGRCRFGSREILRGTLLVSHYFLRTRSFARGVKLPRRFPDMGPDEIEQWIRSYDGWANRVSDHSMRRFAPQLKSRLTSRLSLP